MINSLIHQYVYYVMRHLSHDLQVTQKRQWRYLYDKLGGNPNSTSAATFTRRHYEKYGEKYPQWLDYYLPLLFVL